MEYTKESFTPLQLFNFYDNCDFESFVQITEKQSPHLKDIKYYVENCFEKYENQHLIIQLLLIFPYLVFSDIPYLDFKGQIDNIESLSNKEKLQSLLNLRIERDIIDKTLHEVEKIENAHVDRREFFSYLFISIYKYCFIQLVESIYWQTKKYSNGRKVSINMSIKEFTNRLDKLSEEIEIKNNSIELIKLNDEYEKFTNSFGFNFKYHRQIINELKLFTSNSKLARHLYKIIDDNITLPLTLKNKEKNKVYRPLFRELVCKICYPDFLSQPYSNDDLSRKHRKFIDTYKKNLK